MTQSPSFLEADFCASARWLCSAGEMEKHAGSVRMGGQLAYVAQQAWIVNDSLQSNVLFGQELNDQRWEDCVHACSLQQDLEVRS